MIKVLPKGLSEKMNNCIHIVNFLKASSLNSKIFSLLLMKITAKAIDVNDIFVDVSVTANVVYSCKYPDDGSSSYRNVYKNIVCICCFGRYFHYQAIEHFCFSLQCEKMGSEYQSLLFHTRLCLGLHGEKFSQDSSRSGTK